MTENLRFLGSFGYFEAGGGAGGRPMWNVRLRHNFNPLTYQQLQFRRGTTEPDRQIEESWSYMLSHVFQPDLAGYLYAIHSTYIGIPGYAKIGGEDHIGLLFTYALAQRTLLRVGGAYTATTYENPLFFANSDSWIARAAIVYRFTKSMDGQLLYQFRDRDSSLPLDSYYENKVVLTLVKYF